MSYRTVDVAIPRKHAKWFRENQAFPARVQVHPRAAVFAAVTYALHPRPGGWTAVSKRVGGARIVIGEYSAASIRYMTNFNAGRALRVLRAAAHGGPYLCPVAYRAADGALVHPGACWAARAAPGEAPALVYTLKESEDRCPICQEGFA